jgi:hypothetical protein
VTKYGFDGIELFFILSGFAAITAEDLAIMTPIDQQCLAPSL